MWSGPRNISSALMRSFENRDDTWVCDEPFYGCYLQASGAKHPGYEEIIESMICNYKQAIKALTTDKKDSLIINYQKHMTHHLPPEMSTDWLLALKNCFLIRDPVRVISSYAKVRPKFSFEELGLQQQRDLFELCAQSGDTPPVIDASRCLEDPEGTLRKLCARLNISFSPKMLKWRSGSRISDGVWGKHWYQELNKSTSFSLNINQDANIDTASRHPEILEKALDIYNELLEYSL